MTTSVQRRRGSSVQHTTFTGLEGEITVDTTKDTAVVHDGSTIGGFPLAKETLENTKTTNLTAIIGTDTASDDTFLIYDASASEMKKITRAELNNAIEVDALSNVTITGGSINGTSVGTTTASTGKFTTLESSSTTALNGTTIPASKTLLVTTDIGTSVQGYDADLTTLGAGGSGARTFLGLGTAATTDATAYATAAQGTKADNALTALNPSYTGTLTGGTGVVNLGSGQFYKDASGNVGIGTTSPTVILDVYKAAYPEVRVRSASYTNTFGIDTVGGFGVLGSVTNNPFVFTTNNTERMRIDSSGNVGIGTSSPASKLHVVPSLTVEGGWTRTLTSGDPSYNIFIDSQWTNSQGVWNRIGQNFAGVNTAAIEFAPGTTSGAIIFHTNTATTERMRIDSSGNVGIGTASPSSKLQVVGSTQTIRALRDTGSGGLSDGDTGGAIAFGTSAGTGTGYVGAQIGISAGANWTAGTSQPSNLLFSTVPSGSTTLTERMRIDSGGNLLIGTTSAFGLTGTLQIISNTAGQICLRHASSTAGKYWKLGPDSAGSAITIFNQDSIGQYMGDGATSWTANSDERLKENLVPISDAANKVVSLRAVTGNYISDKEKRSRAFLIAQDVQKVLPEAVNIQDDEQGTLGVAYTDLIPLLVAAISEQQAMIQNLTTRLNALEGK